MDVWSDGGVLDHKLTWIIFFEFVFFLSILVARNEDLFSGFSGERSENQYATSYGVSVYSTDFFYS